MAQTVLTDQPFGPLYSPKRPLFEANGRSGACTITMSDAQTFPVAHSVAEVRRKMDEHATAPAAAPNPAWVAFDTQAVAGTVVLNVHEIARVA